MDEYDERLMAPWLLGRVAERRLRQCDYCGGSPRKYDGTLALGYCRAEYDKYDAAVKVRVRDPFEMVWQYDS